MSDSDSFIDEVTEEVRRDKLFAAMRRYGWIAIAAVLVLVGGASWNEWRKAQANTAAEARGDALLAALQPDVASPDRVTRIEALAAQADQPSARAILDLIAAAEQGNQGTAGDAESEAAARAEAATRLEALAATPELRNVYRDLAILKAVLLRGETLTPDERIARLDPLTQAGAPYRLLAEEQIALADIEAGKAEDARTRLQTIVADAQASADQRRRAQQLIVALGEGAASE